MSIELVRAFIAVPLPAELRAEMSRCAAAAFSDLTHVRETATKSMHLTLKFLGEIKPAAANEIGARLKDIASRHEAFRLRVEGVDGFPNLKFPRVVFADVKGEIERIAALAADVEKLASGFGVPPEGRPFSAHLTLIRVKGAKQMGLLRKRIESLADRVFGEFPVEEIVLYRSDLRPEGARYTPLAGARLIEQGVRS